MKSSAWIVRLISVGASAMLITVAPGCSDESASVSSQIYSQVSDTSLAVPDTSDLEVSNFAGNVEVTPGAPNVVHVVVEKLAARQEDVNAIAVEMVGLQNGARVRTSNPFGVTGVSVDLELTVPTDMRPVLQVAAGTIEYRGRVRGECHFAVSAGSITLRLPADLNASVYLSVAAGSIRVDFPVVGLVSDHIVDGVIGTGADGRIVAQVAAGSIAVIPQ